MGVLSWAMAGYRPAEYRGKITFFWAAEEPEIARSWQPVLRHKHPATIEQHTVPGDHMTTVTWACGLAQSIAERLIGSLRRVMGRHPAADGPTRRAVGSAICARRTSRR